MKAVSIEDLSWQPYPGQRSTTTEYLPLHQGEPGKPDNYELTIVRIGADGNFSPRHRHNFEQIRWAFNHPVNYGPKLDLLPGQLGYFPEGGYYGPFSIPPGTEWLIVQFGGLSGAGYLSWQELMRGYLELKELGEFKDGVYRSVKPGGKAFNKDGYEAIWEHVHRNTPIEYPTPKYPEPVIMNPAGFEWRVDPEDDGVSRRMLGTFGERGPSAQLVRLPPGGHYGGARHSGTSLLAVVSGKVVTQDRSFPTRSAFALAPNERAELSATRDAEAQLLVMNLPVFS
jgi:hypothetical protein